MVANTVNQSLMEVEHTPAMHKKVLDIMPGVAGGVTRVMVGQPFDTIKTRLQVMGQGTALAKMLPPSDVYLNSGDCLRKMIRNEGPLSLYRGTVAPLLGNMALLGIHFPVFSATRKRLDALYPTGDAFSPWKVLAAGGAAGLAGSLVSCPSEHVRTKMMLQRRAALAAQMGLSMQGLETYKGSVDCALSILRQKGLPGLYRGFTSTVLRDIQGYAWFFFCYEATLHALAGPPQHRTKELDYKHVMAAGVMAGFGLWGSMFPIDTIKSKMQGDSLSNPQYRSTLDCLRQSVAVEGYAGLFRGFGAAMYRAIPVNAGIFLAVEGTRQLIAKYETAQEEQRAAAPVPAGQGMLASTPAPRQ